MLRSTTTALILGVRRRGRPCDGPFDHATGRGHVAAYKGDYHDALYVKHNSVVPMIVETFGGIRRFGVRKLRTCAKIARGLGKTVQARDTSKYGG